MKSRKSTKKCEPHVRKKSHLSTNTFKYLKMENNDMNARKLQILKYLLSKKSYELFLTT